MGGNATSVGASIVSATMAAKWCVMMKTSVIRYASVIQISSSFHCSYSDNICMLICEKDK